MNDKILQAFNFGTIQDCANIKIMLDKNNITWEEFLSWVQKKRQDYVPPIPQKIPLSPRYVLKRRCPKCKTWLEIGEVNHKPCAMVGNNFKCQWICRRCFWDEFSFKDIVEEATPYIEEEIKTKSSIIIPASFINQVNQVKQIKSTSGCSGCGKSKR